MKIKLYLLAFSPLLLLGAQETNSSALPDTMRLSVGAYIVGDHKTLFTLKDHDGYAGTVDLQNILRMKTETTSAFINGYYRLSPKHRIEFGFGKVNSSANATYGKILFPNTPIAIDLRSTVDSHLYTSVWKLLYTYSFYHNEAVELGLSLGLHRTKIDYEISAHIGENGVDKGFSIVIAPPIPVFGARFEYEILKAWRMKYQLDFLSLRTALNYKKAPSIEAVSGYIFDSTLSTEYQFVKHINIGVGVNYNKMNVTFIKKSYDIGLENDVLAFTAYTSLLF